MSEPGHQVLHLPGDERIRGLRSGRSAAIVRLRVCLAIFIKHQFRPRHPGSSRFPSTPAVLPPAQAIEQLVVLCVMQASCDCVTTATAMFSWEEISSFGSLRERDRFLTWMRSQISNGLAEEVHAPLSGPFGTHDRWFRHVSTGTLWRLVPDENPYGPGFWLVREEAA